MNQTNLTGQHSSLCVQMLVMYITRPTASFNMSRQDTKSTLQLGLLMSVTLSPWLSSCSFKYLANLICVVANIWTACVLYRLLHVHLHEKQRTHLWYSSGGGLVKPLWSHRQKEQLLANCNWIHIYNIYNMYSVNIYIQYVHYIINNMWVNIKIHPPKTKHVSF